MENLKQIKLQLGKLRRSIAPVLAEIEELEKKSVAIQHKQAIAKIKEKFAGKFFKITEFNGEETSYVEVMDAKDNQFLVINGISFYDEGKRFAAFVLEDEKHISMFTKPQRYHKIQEISQEEYYEKITEFQDKFSNIF